MTTFLPLRDLILVEPIKPEVKVGSLIVASEEHLKPTKGRVLAVGPGTYDKKGVLTPVSVSIGDIVTWSKGAVQRYQVGKSDFHVVAASQLIGIER